MPNDQDLNAILEDPCTSYWLRNALTTALSRDPVDAAADALQLSEILEAKAQKLLSVARN